MTQRPNADLSGHELDNIWTRSGGDQGTCWTITDRSESAPRRRSVHMHPLGKQTNQAAREFIKLLRLKKEVPPRQRQEDIQYLIRVPNEHNEVRAARSVGAAKPVFHRALVGSGQFGDRLHLRPRTFEGLI